MIAVVVANLATVAMLIGFLAGIISGMVTARGKIASALAVDAYDVIILPARRSLV